jgi:hypothetical protein
MSVLYIRDKTTGKFVPITTIKGEKGDTGAVDGLEYYTSAPKALGNASQGTSDYVARGDHVHPKPTPADIGAATQEDVSSAMAKAQEAIDAVNARLNIKKHTVIPTTSWSGASAPYTCELPVEGVYASDTPIMDLVASTDAAKAEKEEESYSKIYKVVTSENKITLYARERPTIGMTVQFLNI